jgi:hypothetical protein
MPPNHRGDESPPCLLCIESDGIIANFSARQYPGSDSQCKSGLRKIIRKVRLEFAKFDWTRQIRNCLVQLKIARGTPRLLGFAICVLTISTQVVQI